MPYNGLTGKLTIADGANASAGAPVAYISNWSVEETRDVTEVTQLGAKTKEVLPSLLYWSASAEGAADFSDGAQQALRKAMVDGKPVAVRFYLDDSTYLDGTAVVTAFSVSLSAEDKGGVSISLTGSGELTLTVNGANGSANVGGTGAGGSNGSAEQTI